MGQIVQNWDFNQFYCTQCGNRGIDIIRAKRKREAGHLKRIFCLHCQKETNHVECKGKYTHEKFLDEFYNHNFDIHGNRKLPLPQFNAYMNERKPVEIKSKSSHHGSRHSDMGFEWKGKIYDMNLDEVK